MKSDWNALTRYDGDHLTRIALPLGGIGTGTVSLGGRGDLRDWEIMNRPAKHFTPQGTGRGCYPSIVLSVARASGERVTIHPKAATMTTPTTLTAPTASLRTLRRWFA